ncbi:MAG: filamentous hemagglutinin N-terminal domain-containing protein [Geitlerinemataceae cyanobacterium]
MKFDRTVAALNSVLAVAVGLFPTASIAQIVPDSSLPVNSIVAPNGNIFTIDGGTTAGSHLFHSFSDFSLPTGSEAFFNNTLSIENIITRVTGGNISNIDGLIRANGTANLFLLNPNGIVFGPNARLDIGGSFLGSTADSVLFQDGSVFSATEANAPPLLTINVPIGLQMGQNPGAIGVMGTGHQLTTAIPGVTPVTSRENVQGLEVQGGYTLAFVGGDLDLQGGILKAEGGQIELGSVRDATVALNLTARGLTLDYLNSSDWGKIVLSQRSLVNAGGVNAGSIRLSGGEISFDDSSLLWVQNLGTQPAGSIEVRASELLNLDNSNSTLHDPKLASGLVSEAMNLGAGSKIVAIAPQLTIDRGGQIISGTFGEGRGGDLSVAGADIVRVRGLLPTDNFGTSRIATQTSSSGDAGNISVSTGNLSVLDRGSVASFTSGRGTTGEVIVNANEIELLGTVSNIGSLTTGLGNADRTTLNTRTLQIRDGGILSSSSIGAGNSGSIVVRATESVEVGNSPGSSSITQIRSAVLVPSVSAQRVFGLSPIPTGTAGTIEIYSPLIELSEGGQISVRNEGTGNAGNIDLEAHSIVLDGGSLITATTTSGEGGNILAGVRDLRLQDDSAIDTESFSSGNGGNVTLNIDTITLLENSRITANATEGMGGNIQITTQGLFASPNSRITASSQFGVDGIVTITNPEVDPSSSLVNFSQEVVDPAEQVVAGCQWTADSEFVAIGRGGVPANPNRPLPSSRTWLDVRDLSEFQGETVVTTPEPSEISTPLVEANTWVRHEDGTIELVARSSTHSPSWQPSTDCNPLEKDEDVFSHDRL